MKEELLARWNAYSSKEKKILSGLGATIVIFLVFAFIWLPVQQGRVRLAKDIPEKKAKLLLMHSQAADIEHLRSQFKLLRNTQDGLKTTVQVSAKIHGLVPNYQQEEKGKGSKSLGIVLSQVSFDTWIKWVESLQSLNHVNVISSKITPIGSAGLVKVEAVFTVSESS